MNDSTCPMADTCGNYERLCHICVRYNCYEQGRSSGKGRQAEKARAKLRNNEARVRGGSGNAAHAKGDIIEDGILHEVKYGYGSKSITIQREWLLKIFSEAIAEGRLPVLDFKFNNSPDGEWWVALDAQAFYDMFDELQLLRDKVKNNA